MHKHVRVTRTIKVAYDVPLHAYGENATAKVVYDWEKENVALVTFANDEMPAGATSVSLDEDLRVDDVQEYFVTFGGQHGAWDNDPDRESIDLGRRYLRFVEPNEAAVRQVMYAARGRRWAHVYTSAESAGIQQYNLQLIRLEEVADEPGWSASASARTAARLLPPTGEYAVTVANEVPISAGDVLDTVRVGNDQQVSGHDDERQW